MLSRRLLSLLLTTAAYATAASLPYQGILTDEKGVPVPDGEKSIAFDVYGQSTGGSALWSEVRTVTTRKGLFSLSLGTVTPLPEALFARDSLFLNVAVSGTSQVPRTPLGTSPWAVRARTADVAQFAKDAQGLGAKLDTGTFNSRLSAYAKTADLSTYAKTTALAGYATNAALNSVAASVGAKLDSSRAVRFDAYGRVKLPDTSSLEIARDPNTGWGTSLSSVWGLSIYSGGDDGSFSLRKSDSTYGVALRASNRGGTYDIFKTDGRDVSFAGDVAIAGGVKLPTTSAIQFDRDATSGWGTEVSASGLHIYSGGDDGTFSLVKSNSAYGVALRVANRGGTYEVFNSDGHGMNFGGNVVIAGSLKLKTAPVVVPDYVFEPDYRLAPLSEVEAYVTTNKHLPEVPSAKEIEAGGIDLAQMNLLLLKKVEELTLHAIAQEKRIQALEERLK